ncbi:MAG TPA: S-methyl-5-thioribose-1-phosphate isomerase, partial [Pseudomonadales bacterium]|nr:S-methyl-5-thioribose-1-phosphate isomerase [Pseudomonadales bacterium]
MDQSVAAWERTPAFGFDAARGHLSVLDQTRLPFEKCWLHPASVADCVQVIRAMSVRGAPLIGLVAAAGMALAAREDSSDAGLASAAGALLASRPTAVNLGWALARMQARLAHEAPTAR